MTPKQIPYRVTIELAIGGQGKTIQLTGETPDLRAAAGGATEPDALLCAIAANALLWQSNALAHAASDHVAFEKMRQALNIPIPDYRM